MKFFQTLHQFCNSIRPSCCSGVDKLHWLEGHACNCELCIRDETISGLPIMFIFNNQRLPNMIIID